MICQSCNENAATVHLTEIVQKTKKETHLCEDCAKLKGVSYSVQFKVKDYLSGVGKPKAAEQPTPPVVVSASLSPSDETDASTGAAAASATVPEVADGFEPCPSCGISFADFRQSGRLGCYYDYEHFSRGLIPLLEKIHGHRQHTGRVPEKIGERIRRQRELTEHRQELQTAVEREDYEAAAILRDKIKALEAGAL